MTTKVPKSVKLKIVRQDLIDLDYDSKYIIYDTLDILDRAMDLLSDMTDAAWYDIYIPSKRKEVINRVISALDRAIIREEKWEVIRCQFSNWIKAIIVSLSICFIICYVICITYLYIHFCFTTSYPFVFLYIPFFILLTLLIKKIMFNK